MLVGKKKIKFKPSATSIAKEQETEPSPIHSTGATTENLGGEGRKAPAPSRTTSSPCVHKADCQLGQVWVASAATSLPGLHLPVVGGWQQQELVPTGVTHSVATAWAAPYTTFWPSSCIPQMPRTSTFPEHSLYRAEPSCFALQQWDVYPKL